MSQSDELARILTCDGALRSATFNLSKSCDIIANGMRRIQTPFHYPDGSNIDIFVGPRSSIADARQMDVFSEWIITDLGQTIAYLLDLGINPLGTKKRQRTVADVCDSLAIRRDRGMLFAPIARADEFSDIAIRLSQACIRVADVAYTQRLREVNIFREDVEEFLETSDLRWAPAPVLPGRFQNPVQLDFEVTGRQSRSLVRTLSTGSSSLAHGMSVEVFSNWYDLAEQKRSFNFVSVFDSERDIFRPEDLERLGEVSEVLGYPLQAERLKEQLAA